MNEREVKTENNINNLLMIGNIQAIIRTTTTYIFNKIMKIVLLQR